MKHDNLIRYWLKERRRMMTFHFRLIKSSKRVRPKGRAKFLNSSKKKKSPISKKLRLRTGLRELTHSQLQKLEFHKRTAFQRKQLTKYSITLNYKGFAISAT